MKRLFLMSLLALIFASCVVGPETSKREGDPTVGKVEMAIAAVKDSASVADDAGIPYSKIIEGLAAAALMGFGAWRHRAARTNAENLAAVVTTVEHGFTALPESHQLAMKAKMKNLMPRRTKDAIKPLRTS